MAGVIDDYVAALKRDLDFDPALARRMADRWAFAAAIALGAVGWWAFRDSVVPLALCLAALTASIAAGIGRAGLFVDGAPLHVLLAAAGEIALIGLLLFHVIGFGRSLKRTASLRRVG